ncbi:hypothetical protein B0T24DRAFT_597715 [Lasiosphaeria ovina]|uniref:Uncharacterized protein n=1 Tax=Lasiosphaeria ovina TaxID=92902 RepID=A0AAE0N0A0_9PEZI|nr:hypothetical protein B0T24DRAFT_597715 [Lasiosphaeria ovina]
MASQSSAPLSGSNPAPSNESDKTNTRTDADANDSNTDPDFPYKSKLDDYARSLKHPIKRAGANPSGTTGGTIVEKVSEYIPAVGKVLGAGESKGAPEPAAASEPEIGGPPNRPDHDPQIAEFVRDQHRSKGVMPEAET